MEINDKSSVHAMLTVRLKKNKFVSVIGSLDTKYYLSPSADTIVDILGERICSFETYYNKLRLAYYDTSGKTDSSSFISFCQSYADNFVIGENSNNFLNRDTSGFTRLSNTNDRVELNNRQIDNMSYSIIVKNDNEQESEELSPVKIPESSGIFEIDELADHIVTKYLNIDPNDHQYNHKLKTVLNNLKKIKTDKNEI